MSVLRRMSLSLVAAVVLSFGLASVSITPAFADPGRGRRQREVRTVRTSPRAEVHVTRPRARVVVREPRARVVVREPRRRVVVVRPAPPAPRVVVAPRPRPNYTWVEGYWRWNGRAYVWREGYWVATRPGRRFVQARWEMRGGDWVFVPSGWVVVR